MRRIIYFLLISIFVLSLHSCKKESAADYNNTIIEQQIAIVLSIDNLKKAIDNYNAIPAKDAIAGMNKSFDEAISLLDSGINVVKALKPFKKDETFKNGALTLFEIYKQIVENEYKEIINLYKIPDEMFKPEDQQKLDELLTNSNKKLEEAYNTFTAIQKQFAEKYNLTLE